MNLGSGGWVSSCGGSTVAMRSSQSEMSFW
jgi:hypothetical protein